MELFGRRKKRAVSEKIVDSPVLERQGQGTLISDMQRGTQIPEQVGEEEELWVVACTVVCGNERARARKWESLFHVPSETACAPKTCL